MTFVDKKRLSYLREIIEEAGLTFESYTSNKFDGMISASATYKGERRIFMIHMAHKHKDKDEMERMERFKREMDSPTIVPPPAKPMALALTEALKALAPAPAPLQPPTPHNPEPTMTKSTYTRAETGKAATKNGLRIGRISAVESYKLFEWVKETDMSVFKSHSDALAAASKFANVNVTDKLFNQALEMHGKTVQRANPVRNLIPRAATVTMATSLIAVMTGLGMPIPDELKKLIE